MKSNVFYRKNEQIRARTVRLIGEDGKQIGVVALYEARKLAQEKELDLVEIAPKANPPVARIIDYSKFLYLQKKKKQEEKRSAKSSETKEVRLGPFIDEHDLQFKLKRAKEFIIDGNKVKFAVRFRGRQITRKESGEQVLKKVIEILGEEAKIDRDIHMEGRQMVLMMSRAKQVAKKSE